MQEMVNVYFFGKKYSVPADLTIMTAMEYAGYTLKRGCGCCHGFCGACATIYRIKFASLSVCNILHNIQVLCTCFCTCITSDTAVDFRMLFCKMPGWYFSSDGRSSGKTFDRKIYCTGSKTSYRESGRDPQRCL